MYDDMASQPVTGAQIMNSKACLPAPWTLEALQETECGTKAIVIFAANGNIVWGWSPGANKIDVAMCRCLVACFNAFAGLPIEPLELSSIDINQLIRICISPQREMIEKLRGALADIAHSDDMTLDIARRKAKRIYDETDGPLLHS